jgi:hypothetical protein
MTKIQKEWKPLRALVLNIRAFFKKRNHKKKKETKQILPEKKPKMKSPQG